MLRRLGGANGRLDRGGPAIANGVVYTGSSFENAIYAFNADTGALLWSYSGVLLLTAAIPTHRSRTACCLATLTRSFKVYAFRLP
jgi:outer membrane protein assembly factor BamB